MIDSKRLLKAISDAIRREGIEQHESMKDTATIVNVLIAHLSHAVVDSLEFLQPMRDDNVVELSTRIRTTVTQFLKDHE